MAKLLDDETRDEVRALVEGLHAPVTLLFFTQQHACGACVTQRRLLEELVELSDKLRLEVKELVQDTEEARRYGVNKVPATCVLSGERDPGIRFFGVTAGYELGSLVQAVRMVSTGESGLGDELESWVARIDRPLHLEVMVTLTCPYCPRMVHLVHQMALVNDHIRADMVDAAEFPQLVQRYDVTGVPRTVIDERPAFEGALPAPNAILEILRVARPAEHARLDQELREAAGERRVRAVATDRVYDVVIVGAGIAAMTAALYAARKDLDVALLGDKPGGQMRDTATIDNWPGVPRIGGDELSEQLLRHAERYRFDESLDVCVTSVERAPEGFWVTTKGGDRYRARTVIYAAGKEYRRLGVAGEDRFLGRGIAFCATCDAPLFRDRRVAIVGGGNSAFTAARDLLPFARELHVVNILPDWQADRVLFDEVASHPKVHLHPAMRVVEFLGRDQLAGVRLVPVSDGEPLDLLVEGAFLEIGLVPNAGPVASLVERSPAGEVVVGRDQATSVPGLFAAGDVTDEPDKQLVVASAAGAKAALAAYRYLTEALPEGGTRRRAQPPKAADGRSSEGDDHAYA